MQKNVEGVQSIINYLARVGPSSAQELCKVLQISQPTFSRLVSQSSLILRMKRGPQTLYAVRRFGGWLTTTIPLCVIDEKGTLSQVATLHPIQPKGIYVEVSSEMYTSKIYDDIPYFLDDLRPSGFLGRLEPKLYPAFNFPPDINMWTEDNVLTYLVHCGWDLIGNIIIGEKSSELYLQHRLQGTDICNESLRASRYPEIAEIVLSHGIAGSSAGGEHPKFMSIRSAAEGLTPVMVKFSPPVGDAISRRVADLLVCEHIAHQVMRIQGKAAAQSSFIWGDDKRRLFLEIERFDRNTTGGRCGIISLRALDLEFAGKGNPWTEIAESLLTQGKISQIAYADIVWLEVFGKLIGNTDRHYGNISFFCNGERIDGLAPAYDMLPMMYAPQQNQLIDQIFNPESPKFPELSIWNQALEAAQEFWRQVQKHPEISAEFKKLTATNEAKLALMRIST